MPFMDSPFRHKLKIRKVPGRAVAYIQILNRPQHQSAIVGSKIEGPEVDRIVMRAPLRQAGES
jgi:hypothetical protein